MRRSSYGRASDTRFSRCPHRRSPEFFLQTKGALELCRNGSSNEGRFTEAKRLSGRDRWLRRDAARIIKRCGGSLRQIQRGDVDLVDVAQSVASIVQLLQEFFVAQASFQRLVGKAAAAGEEKPFAVGRN